MGYRVEYQPVKKVRGAEKRRSRVLSLSALFFLILCILVSCFLPREAEVMKEVLIPGEAAVTAAALDRFAEELKMGETVRDALMHFCQLVLAGENA